MRRLTAYQFSRWMSSGRTRQMRKSTGGFLMIAGIIFSQNVGAKAPTQPVFRFTPIHLDQSGASCSLFLERRNTVFVGGMNYEDSIWHLGINGRSYRFEPFANFSNPLTLHSENRRITVRMTKLRTIDLSRESGYPNSTDTVSVTIMMNGATSTVMAYRNCGDG